MNKKLKDDKLTTNISFKAKGNKIQYEFNSQLIDNIEEAYELWKKGSVNRLEAKLEKVLYLLSKRNKLIRIADRSEGGWQTTMKYMLNELADD